MQDGQALAVRNEPKGKARCGAKTRGERGGRPCQNWGLPNGRCRMHGGKALTGMAAPQFTTGRYSRYLPNRLLEKYAAASQDVDLHDLAEEIKLIDTRLADLLGRLASDWGSGQIRAALDLIGRFKAAAASGDVAAAQATIRDLEGSLTAVSETEASWDKVLAAVDVRRRLVESDIKRRQTLQQMLPIDTVMHLSKTLAMSVRKHVTDPAVRQAIQADMQAAGVA